MPKRPTATKADKREVSPLIPQTLMRYVADAMGTAVAAEVVERAGLDLTLEQLHEPSRWFSATDVIDLAAAASDLCGDTDIGRRAGERLFYDGCAVGMSDFITSEGSVERAMPGIVAKGTKMSTGATFRVAGEREREIVVEGVYRWVTPSHAFYCAFTAGYYSMVPSLFGSVGRVAQPTCQARGDASCRYHLTWSEDPRPHRRDASPTLSAARMERTLSRFEQLQSMATELVRADDVDDVLDKITERAGIAVHAPRFLLAARTEPSERLRVHHFGFRDDEDAHTWADRLLGDEVGEGDGVLVAHVRSARRDYGVLAAVYADGAEFGPVDQRLIDAYAGHAAAALEVVASLAAARRDRDSAHAILGLARELAVVGTTDEITNRLARAIVGVTGCDRSSVWLWDEADETITLAANHDVDSTAEVLPGGIQLSVDDLPEIATMVESPRAALLQDGSVPGPVQVLLKARGLASAVIVPIVSRSRFIGMVTAGFRQAVTDGPAATELLDRLDGVAHYAATAFENAELLDHTRSQALHDALTGLPNRALVHDRAQLALGQARRSGAGVGLLFVDLDRFKNVNDSLGHGAGDELIRAVARRLESVVREGDTLGRLGGDEFTVLLPSVAGLSEAERVAERLIRALAVPFTVNGQELFISCSIGIACAPTDGVDYESLMRNADAAMYEAKALGRGTYAIHSSALHRDRRQRLELESRLHTAVENDELRVYFQAQIDMQTMRSVGVEALVRWEHPELGLLPPAAFLPLAEESGLIVNIDRWVRKVAFAQGREWAEAGTPVRIAVNLSTRELGNPRLIEQLASELRVSGLAPELVEIEVTDRVVMDADDLPGIIDGLRRLGVSVAIDDFGTGNSVLGRLQRCAVDTLKIDKAFVQEITPGSAEAPVVKALIALAQSLDLKVVAEGVETELQAEVLRGYACGLAQGFLYSRPVPIAEMTAELRAGASQLVRVT